MSGNPEQLEVAEMAQRILQEHFHFNQFDNSWEEHVREDEVQYWTKTDEGLELTSYIRPLILVDEDPLSSPVASQSISRCGSEAATSRRTSLDGASSEVVQNMFDSPAATLQAAAAAAAAAATDVVVVVDNGGSNGHQSGGRS